MKLFLNLFLWVGRNNVKSIIYAHLQKAFAFSTWEILVCMCTQNILHGVLSSYIYTICVYLYKCVYRDIAGIYVEKKIFGRHRRLRNERLNWERRLSRRRGKERKKEWKNEKERLLLYYVINTSFILIGGEKDN